MHLEGKSNGDSHDEEEEGHNEVCQRAAIPWRVVNARVHPSSIIHEYHQLQPHHTVS